MMWRTVLVAAALLVCCVFNAYAGDAPENAPK